MKELNVNLTKVLTTHHHYDHADGNPELVKSLQKEEKIRVYGGDDRIPAMTDKVSHNDKLKVNFLSI